MARRIQFKVGDSVFYPAAGVGEIQAIEDFIVGGKLGSCYVIKVQESQAVIRLPKTNITRTGIRPLLSSRRVKELYRVLSGKNARRVTGGNWTERCKELERKINTGTSIQLGEVVRDLTRWKSNSGLSFEESMLLETATVYLSNELAAVQGIEPEHALDKIRECVNA